MINEMANHFLNRNKWICSPSGRQERWYYSCFACKGGFFYTAARPLEEAAFFILFVQAAADRIDSLFSVSEKMLRVIAYLFKSIVFKSIVFKSLEEITPLMLQKLLYFIQGIYLALYGVPIFVEDCGAWA